MTTDWLGERATLLKYYLDDILCKRALNALHFFAITVPSRPELFWSAPIKNCDH